MWRFLLFQRLVPRNSPTKKLAPIVIFNATLLKHVKNHMMKTDSEAGCFYVPTGYLTGWAEFEQACRRGALCEPPEEVESWN